MQKTSNSSFAAVIKNKGFLNLWINQIVVQLCYNSLNFALIIWIFQLTDTNTAVSALLVVIYLPAVIFGLFSGVIIDAIDKKKIFLCINLLLTLAFLSLFVFKYQYPAVLIITFLINTLSHLYSTTEATTIPMVTPKHQLLTANSLFSTTLQMTFLLGFGLAGPLISHLGINTVFAVSAALLFVAFIMATRFPLVKSSTTKESRQLIQNFYKRDFSNIKRITFSEVKNTLKHINNRLPVQASILILAGVQSVIGVLAVLIPSFLERVIHIKATDASYVLIIPLGLGLVLGASLAGKICKFLPKRWVVGGAVTLTGLLFFLVGISPLISPVIRYFPVHQPLPFFYQPSLSTILATGSFILGIMMVLIIVPSQTVLQENIGENFRGKVYSILGVVMSAVSLLPVLGVGILADVFGTMPILVGLGGSIALIGLLALKPDFFFRENHLSFRIRKFLGIGHWRKRQV